MEQSRTDILNKLEERLDYVFRDKRLLSTALTHRSYINEHPQLDLSDNERLEFLGDSVLGLCVSDFLIKKFATSPEGDLTKIRAALVGERNLARMAANLQMGDGLLIGHGEETSGSRHKESFLANALEALIAAVYLDSDYNTVRDVIMKLIEARLPDHHPSSADFFDYKTALQELCQKRYKTIPAYMVVDSKGPEHAKIFNVQVAVVNKLTEYGSGRSKKEAEKQAAKKAWKILQNEAD